MTTIATINKKNFNEIKVEVFEFILYTNFIEKIRIGKKSKYKIIKRKSGNPAKDIGIAKSEIIKAGIKIATHAFPYFCERLYFFVKNCNIKA